MDQNHKESIKLLKAINYVYSKSKRVFNIRIAVVTIYAGVVIIASHNVLSETLNSYFVLGSLGFTIGSMIVKVYERELTKKGAVLQEMFDEKVLGIEWNSFLIGDRIWQNNIGDWAKKYQGETASLEDWYESSKRHRTAKSKLKAQLESILWDANLKKEFFNIILTIIFLILGLGLIIGIFNDVHLTEYLTLHLAATLPLLISLIELGVAYSNEFKTKLDRGRKIEELLKFETNCDLQDLRKIQDFLFVTRKEGYPIPNFYYHMRRNSYQVKFKWIHDL